jgi:hypothetical protein
MKRVRHDRQAIKSRKRWSEIRVERRSIPAREVQGATAPDMQVSLCPRPELRSIAAEVAHLVRNAPLRFPKVLF